MNTSSKKEFSISIDGKTYHVKIQELTGGELAVELDGTIHRVSLAEIADMEECFKAAQAEKTAAPLPLTASRPTERPAAGTDQMTAPMPGDIVEIMVKAGDQVKLGQEVCVLEAMKMKNILRAPRDAVVKSVEVSVGVTVNYGDVLVRFDS
jgi:biotin carboxyl carrier protein